MKKEKKRKGRRIVNISPIFFVKIFTTGKTENFIVKSGLPSDAKIVQIRFDPFMSAQRERIQFLFESNEWSPIKEGKLIPEIDIVLKSQKK